MNFIGGREGLAFMSKINTVRDRVDEYYVGDVDWDYAADMVSGAIVDSAGDKWSGYLTAEAYEAYSERSQNSSKGIGVTVTLDEQGRGAYVKAVNSGYPAENALSLTRSLDPKHKKSKEKVS